MKNRESLFHNDKTNYEEMHHIYEDAFVAGRMAERALAMEAYRLRCRNLFGNRCMSRTTVGSLTKKICDGNCSYIKQYKLELYKLEK